MQNFTKPLEASQRIILVLMGFQTTLLPDPAKNFSQNIQLVINLLFTMGRSQRQRKHMQSEGDAAGTKDTIKRRIPSPTEGEWVCRGIEPLVLDESSLEWLEDHGREHTSTCFPKSAGRTRSNSVSIPRSGWMGRTGNNLLATRPLSRWMPLQTVLLMLPITLPPGVWASRWPSMPVHMTRGNKGSMSWRTRKWILPKCVTEKHMNRSNSSETDKRQNDGEKAKRRKENQRRRTLMITLNSSRMAGWQRQRRTPIMLRMAHASWAGLVGRSLLGGANSTLGGDKSLPIGNESPTMMVDFNETRDRLLDRPS